MVAQSVTKPAISPKPKREPLSASQKIHDLLKRAAIAGKINKQELESVSVMATALQTFMGT